MAAHKSMGHTPILPHWGVCNGVGGSLGCSKLKANVKFLTTSTNFIHSKVSLFCKQRVQFTFFLHRKLREESLAMGVSVWLARRLNRARAWVSYWATLMRWKQSPHGIGLRCIMKEVMWNYPRPNWWTLITSECWCRRNIRLARVGGWWGERPFDVWCLDMEVWVVGQTNLYLMMQRTWLRV